MTHTIQVLVIFSVLHFPFFLVAGQGCQLTEGLPCNSRERLVSGSSFTITSKTCRNGRYPRKEKCAWYFEVDNCKPSLECETLALKAKTKKCRGDRLKVETENRRKAFCRKKQLRGGFTDENPTSFFDVKFSSNNKGEGTGFKCTVSCSGEPPVTTPTPPVSGCKCGVLNKKTKIVGGTETQANEYPWQVAIASPNAVKPFCGGSILSSDTILTAAHCTIGQGPDSFKVIASEHDVTVDDGQLSFDVCSKKEHPSYNQNTNEHDFAILTLCTPLTFSRTVAPICLPPQQGDAYDDVLSTVTGWGTLSEGGPTSDVLMGVDVNTLGNAECDLDYSDYGSGIIKDSMICAKASGKDACQGDSGGPLITKEAGDFYSLIGVVSFGVGCANPDYPGVYARVTEDLPWIRENINGKQCTNTRKLFTRLINVFDAVEEE